MDEENSLKRLAEDEYEIQHFGFSSSDFMSQFQSVINYTLETVHESMEQCIVKKLKLDDEKKKILNSEVQTLTKKFIKKAEECLEEHEPSIREFFTIPQHIHLDEDKVHSETSHIDIDNLLQEVEELEKQYMKENSLVTLYQQELNSFNRIENLQQQLAKILKQAENIPSTLESISELNNLRKGHQEVMQRLETECNMRVKSRVPEEKKTSNFIPID